MGKLTDCHYMHRSLFFPSSGGGGGEGRQDYPRELDIVEKLGST